MNLEILQVSKVVKFQLDDLKLVGSDQIFIILVWNFFSFDLVTDSLHLPVYRYWKIKMFNVITKKMIQYGNLR